MAPLTLLSPPPELTVFHNPASPASEYAIQALQLGCQRFDVRRVDLAGSRPTEPELRDIVSRLRGDDAAALVRRGRLYAALELDLDGASDETVVATLVEHPALLATPILDDGVATMLGNPIERAEAWAVTGHVVDARPARRAA
ncbi:MAG: ArsC/Spx/MgsR family protein [Solirubrobacteraceae bacterium]|nr:ArsC/Spx/MgsR family protein [Solirubrobacteraceae bacterium]